jgi:hypothetical protein
MAGVTYKRRPADGQPREIGVTRLHPRALAAVVMTAAALACAACGSTTTPAAGGGSSSPSVTPTSGTSSTSSATLTVAEAAPLLVQCFADHHLIPKSALAADGKTLPRADSSTWLHDGKVTPNERFGAWYRDPGSAVVVKGKSIDAWVHAVAASSHAWPTSTCGPMPG